jgi:3-deoxy-manno-octulosonate cytidylyltransferase (CMP-KDO synthetase)|tara:strand:- start:980 stop:1714 length:735 start_codon:yes stop_codon:yes gene_type:complete
MIIALIPSRLNSNRLNRKPLLIIDGLPIIIHTLKRVQLSKKVNKVIVCTDSVEIKNIVEMHGGEAALTSAKHRNGTERIAEISKKFKKAKLIIDVQGDEPLVDPNDIDDVIKFHKKNNNFDIVLPIKTTQNAEDKSLIKVVCSKQNKILYFSRAQIPFNFKQKNIKYFKDLSVISFKPQALKKFSKLEPGKLEVIEGIELLRALENDLSIGTFEAKSSSFGVNVKQDLLRAINEMPRNKIRKLY